MVSSGTANDDRSSGSGMMETTVRIDRVGRVGLIAIDNPPVNAASQAVRQGIVAAISAHNDDPEVGVLALYGQGRTFVAGADIREFGGPPLAPSLLATCAAVENSAKPVTTVLHGTTLGGGLELALAAQARIALPTAVLGFPEVTLGLIPGAGGTQRAPRLIGMAAALDLIASGRRISAEEALTLGLVDRIATGDPRDVAIAAGEDILSGAVPTRRTGEIAGPADDPALGHARAKAATSPLFAYARCVEAVAAASLPLAEGLAVERRLFEACLANPQRAALVHAFFAERAAARIPEAVAAVRDVATVGVVGGGTMGSGIATAFLTGGLIVRLVERDQAALDRAVTAVEANLSGAVARGKMTAAARDTARAALSAGTELATLGDVDLVVEAVFEDMNVKTDLFRALDAIVRPGAILATNTSYLDVNAIAAATGRPEDVLGLHFFAPANVMRLVEVVVTDRSAPDAVATAFALARGLGKVAVRSGVCDGFIGNRILSATRQAVEAMMLDGASPERIDRALEEFGFAMGPFAVSDLSGLDIAYAARRRRDATRPAGERYVAVADRLVERGALGRKSGRGYYLYGGAARQPNPDVAEIIAEERTRQNVVVRDIADVEIVERALTAMIAEAVRILEDGIALRPIDVDAVLLLGYGFPRHRGGPMFHADATGARTLVGRIEAFARDEPQFWRVPDLLRRMADDGTTLAARNGP